MELIQIREEILPVLQSHLDYKKILRDSKDTPRHSKKA